jgi:SAM-dependent methyltransferase
MKDYIERTIAAYDASPAKYEQATKDLSPSEELTWFTEALPLHGYVLDAGCAFGRDTDILAKQAFNVVGVDLSDALLARARLLHPNLSFQKADVCNLPFANGTFDGIWANAVLLHLDDEDLSVALNEFYRVLEPAGRIFISFKKGDGSGNHLESLTSNDERFYNYKLIETLEPMLATAGFETRKWRYVNKRDFDPKARDLEWLKVHAVKTKGAEQ